MVNFPAPASARPSSSLAKEFRKDSEAAFALHTPQSGTERSFSMKQLSVLAAAIALTAGLAGAQTIRAGVFDKQSVVVAFYRSPQWAEVTKAKTAARDAAKKANDTAKVQDLEAWGANHQELAHRQLANEAPIANILEALAPGLPEIARRAGVHLIAPEVAFADSAVQTVDVTDLVLAYLKADSRTLSIIQDLQKLKR
jgi:hypothetical protein